jgi:hypothetical protein
MLKMCPNSKGVVVSFFFFHSFQYAFKSEIDGQLGFIEIYQIR